MCINIESNDIIINVWNINININEIIIMQCVKYY